MIGTKQFVRRAVLIGAFTFASTMPLIAQKLDTANESAMQKQDIIKPEKKKAIALQPKFMARVYGAAQEPAIGAGLEISSVISKKMDIGATGSAAFDGKKLLVEESSIWAGMPISKKVYLVGYAYADKFFNVDIKYPAFGVAAKYGIFKAGFEKGQDFTSQYDKVILPGGVSLGIATLFWGEKIGYDAAIGKLQRYGVTAGIGSKLLKMPLKAELMYTQPTGTGQNGLQVRLTLEP